VTVCNVEVKATVMSNSACAKEVQKKLKHGSADPVPALKPRVQDVVDGRGSYLLFYGKHCAGDGAVVRARAIQDALEEVVGSVPAAGVTVKVYGAEKLAEWTNEHAASVTWVFGVLEKRIPACLQSWGDWRQDLRRSREMTHPCSRKVTQPAPMA